MPNKEPTTILEELKFVGGTFASVHAIRNHTDRISQTLATTATEVERLTHENIMLRKEIKELKKSK